MLDILALIMGAIMAAGAAYLAGRRGGKLTERDRIEKERAKNAQTAKEVREDVDASNADDVYRRLDGWMRDDR